MSRLEDHEEHRLGWVVLGGRGFRIGRKIELAEAEALARSISRLESYKRRDELVLALEAHDQLIDTLDRWEGETTDLERAIFQVASRLSIWLEACRMLLDRTARRISDMFSKESEVWGLWTSATHELFDEYWSYRLAWHLRNMNHRALPPVTAAYHTKNLDDSGISGPVVRLTRSGLLAAHSDWNEMVRRDLEDGPLGDVIDIRQLADEHQSNLNGLTLGVMVAGIGHLREDRDRIAAALADVEESRPTGDALPVLFGLPAVERLPVDRMTVGMIPIERGLVAWFEEATEGRIAIEGSGTESELRLPPEGVTYRP